MNTLIHYLTLSLLVLLTNTAFGVPKSAVDEFSRKLKSRIKNPLEIIVKPYAAFYKKGDRTEPVTVFYLVGFHYASDWWWTYDFAYISDVNDKIELNYIQFTKVNPLRKEQSSTSRAEWKGSLVQVANYTTGGCRFSESFLLEDVRFGRAPGIREGGVIISSTDKYDAVCLDGPCPWIHPKPEVEESKSTEPKVEGPKEPVVTESSIVLLSKTTPVLEPVVTDPIQSVNERKLNIFDRSKKLRNLFRSIPNDPITNWYSWVQENLGPKL
jgi:hypothetical protein